MAGMKSSTTRIAEITPAAMARYKEMRAVLRAPRCPLD